MLVSVHGPQTESIQTIFFSRSPCYFFVLRSANYLSSKMCICPKQHTPYQTLTHCTVLMSLPPQNFTFIIFSHPWF